MIAGRDSAYPPTDAQVQAAKAAGIQVWGGYIATRSGVGLLRAWSYSEFARVKILLGTPLAFCSGWDDPTQLRNLAASWGVRLCLDVESGIRGNGAWVDGFLSASGAGLYGNLWDLNHAAPFYIMASYPGYDPGSTWGGGKGLSAPHGWQWRGTHSEFGIDVDSMWLDDWFSNHPGTAGGGETLHVSLKRALVRDWFISGLGREPSVDDLNNFAGALADDGSNAEVLATQIFDSPEGQAHRAAYAQQGPQGIQGIQGLKGDKGDKGDTGPAGALAPHSHSGSVTVS